MKIALINNLKYGKTFSAVEYQTVNGDDELQLLVLKKIKNDFVVQEEKRRNSIEEIKEKISQSQHVFTIINNTKVLSKTINKEKDFKKALLLAFPTVNLTDFFYEIAQLKEKTHITICRKTYVDNILNSYKQQNINCIGFSLGNCSALQLASFTSNDEIFTSNAKISCEDNEVISIDTNSNIDKTSQEINGLSISNYCVLGLSGILKFYTQKASENSNLQSISDELSKKYFVNRYFNIGLKFGLALLMISLLVNFLVFDNYKNKVENLTVKNQVYETKKEQLVELKNEVLSKKKLADEVLNSATSKTSLMFSEIGKTIPGTIKLSKLDYQPILKKVESQKEITLDKNTMIIEGESTDGKNFSNWLNTLEQLKFVNSVEVINYGLNNKKKTTFEIKIQL